MEFDQLKLENQLCFPLYVASRLITREYKPLLEPLGLTYPQYLVLLVLWENDGLTVNEIAHKLLLNTNTVTPLLKRMESDGLLLRQRSNEDERRVIITLTEAGKALREQAEDIPAKLAASLNANNMSVEDLKMMVAQVYKVIENLSEKQQNT